MKRHSLKTLLAMAVLTSSASASAFSDGGVYSVFDANADGYVDREEFKQLLKRRRIKQEFRHLWQFDAIDQDHDDRISEQEMVDVLQKEVQLRKSLRERKKK